VLSGEVKVGAPVRATVDVDRRKAISRSHTATHMVHKAIREALGDTATQAGSENSPGRFRFDFHASAALPASALRDVEQRVNSLLIEDLEVRADVMTQEEARAAGAMALFGEKYGDAVRVISVGDWTRELCGGTHAPSSGQLGMVRLLGEGSIGSGVRRVEALVGADAYDFAAREHVLVAQLTEALKVRPEELPERVAGLVTQLRDATRQIDTMRAKSLLTASAGLIAGARDVFGVRVVSHDAGEVAADDPGHGPAWPDGSGDAGSARGRRPGQGAAAGRDRDQRGGTPLAAVRRRPGQAGLRGARRWRWRLTGDGPGRWRGRREAGGGPAAGGARGR
jgi:alanyl-tRNA synthetase